MGLPTQTRSDPKEIVASRHGRYRGASRGAAVPTYLLEVAAKVVVHSDEDSIEEFLENTYARIAEFVPSDEHIVNIELDAFPLPQEPGGSSDLGDGADHEEGGQAAVS